MNTVMMHLASFFSVIFFISFFLFFVVSFYRVKKRTELKKRLIAADYEFYYELLSQRMIPLLLDEYNRDNKFFRSKTWPGKIPEDIRTDLEKNLVLERVSVISLFSWPVSFFLTAGFGSLVTV